MTLHSMPSGASSFPRWPARRFSTPPVRASRRRPPPTPSRRSCHDVQTYPERSATAFHIRLDAARDAARPAAARLIGARPEDIALVENTSHGLAIAAAAIPFERGDNILVPDLEYLQVPLPWRQQPPSVAPENQARFHEGGTLPVGRFAAAADGRTRAVVMSSVQWSNGFRADLDPSARSAGSDGCGSSSTGSSSSARSPLTSAARPSTSSSRAATSG